MKERRKKERMKMKEDVRKKGQENKKRDFCQR